MMSNLKRADTPHTAVINIQIKIHKTFKDGSLDPIPMTSKELNKYGIGPCASMKIEGFDKISCIKKIKEKLEKLNG